MRTPALSLWAESPVVRSTNRCRPGGRWKNLGWVAVCVEFLLLGTGHIGAATRWVVPGDTVASFDVFTSSVLAPTFPSNMGRDLGATLLPDGRVALLMNRTVTPNNDRIVHILDLDLQRAGVFRLVQQGPLLVSAGARSNIVFVGGLTLLPPDRFATLGRWSEEIPQPDGTKRGLDHFFVLTFPRDLTSGQTVVHAELPPLEGSVAQWHYWNLVYLPSDGIDPPCFAAAVSGQSGYLGWVQFAATNGVPLRRIDWSTLGLSTNLANACPRIGWLGAAANGDLLTIGSDLRLRNTCFWNGISCVRFTRYGRVLSAFDFGSSLPRDPWEPPVGFGSLTQLANGDLLGGSQFAEYDMRDGDMDGNTFRYFIVRPPVEFEHPRLATSPTAIAFGQIATGNDFNRELTVFNSGAALLQITSIQLEGDTAAFRLEGPASTNLLPSFEMPDAPGSSFVLQVKANPRTAGPAAAKIVFHSNDPHDPTRTVEVTATAVSPSLTNTILLDPTPLLPAAHFPSSFDFTADGSQLLLLASANNRSSSRAISVPAQRDPAGQLTGFDSAGTRTIASGLRFSLYALRRGADGMLWYGPGAQSLPRIYQRKPDGSELERTLAGVYGRSPQDWDFTPDGSALVVAFEGARTLMRYPLVKRPDGFWDFGLQMSLSYLGSTISFSVWPTLGDGLIGLYGGTLWGVAASPGFWDSPTAAEPQSTFVTDSNFPCRYLRRDPASQALIYLDSIVYRIRRLDGFLESIGTGPKPVRFVNWRFRPPFDMMLQWEGTPANAAIEYSTDLTTWTVLPGSLADGEWRGALPDVSRQAFFRLGAPVPRATYPGN